MNPEQYFSLIARKYKSIERQGDQSVKKIEKEDSQIRSAEPSRSMKLMKGVKSFVKGLRTKFGIKAKPKDNVSS